MTITIAFEQSGTFAATWAAEVFLSTRGFSVGSSQGSAHRGILFGNFVISKWRNMNKAEIAQLHGVIRGDGREGPIYIDIFDSAPAAAIATIQQWVPA